MVNDVCPLVQVMHIIAAVIATVTKYQVQHQVLQEKDRQKVRKVDAMTTKMLRASCGLMKRASLFDYRIMRVTRGIVWTESEHHTVYSCNNHIRDHLCSVFIKFIIFITSVCWLFSRKEILLTSIGLFFFPTLLVCSFSGCGSALLTGGLKPTAGIRGRLRSCLSY